jgi:hypothetical protein
VTWAELAKVPRAKHVEWQRRGLKRGATRSHGPASSWGSSRRLTATGRGDRITGRSESVCGQWPWSGAGSAIGDCPFCCAVRGCGQTIRSCFGFIARNGSARKRICESRTLEEQFAWRTQASVPTNRPKNDLPTFGPERGRGWGALPGIRSPGPHGPI